MLYFLIAITFLYSTAFASEDYEFLEDELTDAIFPRTDPYRVGDIYQILKIVDHVFNEKDINYWIDFGTLLGAERHGGIIPWDDDADIIIRVSDFSKINKLDKAFEKHGLVLTKCEIPPWKVHFPGQMHYCVDVFFIADLPGSPNGELTFYSSWAGRWFLCDIEPRRRIKFGPIEVFAPIWPWRRLHEQYGSDCMEMAMYHTHVLGDLPFKVTIVDFNPAEWLVDPNHRIVRLE